MLTMKKSEIPPHLLKYFKPVEAVIKPKDDLVVPHRVALALQADGYYLRSDIPWIKRNGMPGSQQDRPTTSKEYWFLLAKSERYYFDMEAVKMPAVKGSANAGARNYRPGTNGNQRKREGQTEQDFELGRARRESDWFFDSLRAILESGKRKLKKGEQDPGQILLTDCDDPLALTINPTGYKAAHFAVFPPKLIEPMILASPQEVCPACQSPMVRVVEKGDMIQQHWAPGTQEKIDIAQGRHGKTSVMNTGYIAQKITTGWRYSCDCPVRGGNEESVHAIILDPFFGSGTVGQVAIANRRNFIGFELNPTYASELAADRLDGVQIRAF